MKEKKQKTTTELTTEKAKGTSDKKSVKIAKTVLNIVVNILIVAVLVVSILVAVMALTFKSTGISTIFGKTIQTIQSDSMKGGSPDGYGGGDFAAGDLVIAKSTNFDDFAEYNVGDIVTMRLKDTNGDDYLLVHRIVDKIKGADGYYRYQTWGDNREVSQAPDQLKEEDYVAAYDIASVVYSKDTEATVIRGVGRVIDFIRTSQGFFFVVLLPMIIFFVYEIIRVVINAVNYRNAKAREEMEQTEEERKAEIDAAVKAALEAAGKSQEEIPTEEIPPAEDISEGSAEE